MISPKLCRDSRFGVFGKDTTTRICRGSSVASTPSFDIVLHSRSLMAAVVVMNTSRLHRRHHFLRLRLGQDRQPSL